MCVRIRALCKEQLCVLLDAAIHVNAGCLSAQISGGSPQTREDHSHSILKASPHRHGEEEEEEGEGEGEGEEKRAQCPSR